MQTEKVCLGVMGTPGRAALDTQRSRNEEEIFLWLNGLVVNLLAAQNVTKVKFQTLENHRAFDEGRALKVRSEKIEIGVIGLINSKARAAWHLNDPVAAAELNLELLISNVWKIGTVKDLPL